MPHTAEADIRIIDFLEANSNKALKKIITVYDGFMPYLPRNYPWQIEGRAKLLNFAGYEPHLSRVREYTALMGGNYGEYNRSWVLRTGTDFVAWNSASEPQLKSLTQDTITLGPTLKVSDQLSISKLIYSDAASSAPLPLLSLTETRSDAWPVALAMDGWERQGGRLVKVPGKLNHFGIAVKQRKDSVYEVFLDVVGSTRGSISIALGGTRGDPILGNQPGRFGRAFVSDGVNDLWINGTPDFDGAIANIVVRERDGLAKPQVLFDNGVVRLEGNTGQAELVGFTTDWSTHIRAGVSAQVSARLTYLLWPISYFVPFLDGKPLAWSRDGDGPAYLNIPPGDHVFEMRFSDRWLFVFRWVIWAYLILIVASLALVATEMRLISRRWLTALRLDVASQRLKSWRDL